MIGIISVFTLAHLKMGKTDIYVYMLFPSGQVVKNPPADGGNIRDTGSFPGSERSLEEEMASHSSFYIENSHGQRSLEGYSA